MKPDDVRIILQRIGHQKRRPPNDAQGEPEFAMAVLHVSEAPPDSARSRFKLMRGRLRIVARAQVGTA